MDKNYRKLFSELAHAIEITSEQVMEYNHQKQDSKGESTAELMRNDYAKLYDKLDDTEEELTRAEYLKLLAGAYIITNNMEDKIKAQRKAIEGYKIDIIPKLSRIMNETSDDEKALLLANELFCANT